MNLENQATHTTAQTLEQLSAWMDGELAGAELDQLLASLPALDGAEHCYASAHSYLAIGEIMRSPASGATSSLSFLSTLSARIAQISKARIQRGHSRRARDHLIKRQRDCQAGLAKSLFTALVQSPNASLRIPVSRFLFELAWLMSNYQHQNGGFLRRIVLVQG